MAAPGFEPWQHGTTRVRVQPLNLPDFLEQTDNPRSAAALTTTPAQDGWGELPGGRDVIRDVA